ncbi:MmcQ/YjbR family DNA-binding protein [Luteibaculum oceani]|uniref:MmcQ/YjbR family DNA-binding protein n=1 Tax=Luteibaculum oceani TaxID=1294296 RepID=A0A5C6VI36_9FLAO|nr:MmcQ/YjbR family DNA-binding protein [Luteibaculum oceani]TXC85102.1 MmcQ/YjbR family DNA-binding protein [Luteibaculum oceani]
MNLEEFREYCLAKLGTSEHTPFDADTLVFKVGDKMFALTGMANYEFVNLKCNPERAVELRETYSAIKPGYHMSKVHWNSVYPEELANTKLLKELIDHSYELVFNSLTKKLQSQILASES